MIGVYSNEPKHSIRNRSPIHYGTLKLNIIGNPVTALSGHYWTDRGTQGELYLSDCKNAFPEDFALATKMFQDHELNAYCASSGSLLSAPGKR